MASILIIDGNPDDRAACVRALRQSDDACLVFEAADGSSGLAMIEQQRPDCVLLGHAVPGVSGLETLRRIHAADAFLPVILLTGWGSEAIAVGAMQQGAADYIAKSVLTPERLIKAIGTAIARAGVQRKCCEQRREIHRQMLALTAVNRLQTAILHSAATMIVATDLEGRVVAFTPASEVALGYRAQDIIGLHTPLLWLDETEIAARAGELAIGHGARLKSGFEVLTFLPQTAGREIREWTFLRKDGSRFPVRLTMTPLRDEGGELIGFLGLGDDISELKQQNFSLHTSEESFCEAAENAPNGMGLISRDGHVLKANQALCALLGYSEQELTGKPISALTHPEDRDIDNESIKQLFRGRVHSYRIEKRLLHRAGHIVQTLINASLIRNVEGSAKYCVVQVQDISERKEIDRIKSEFISIVSHELRTPLTSIRGSLGLLGGKLGRDLPAPARNLIDIANKNCERLVLLVNDILDMDKLASGGMRFELRAENTGPILEEAAQSIRGYADALGITIRLSPPASDLAIMVDRQRLIQVLNNLLSNAVKFSPPGAEVTMSAVQNGDSVRIWVADHGDGIPEEFQHHLFKPFLQADPPSTRQKGGTGLGLHISKQLITHMGGQIGFDTQPGRGTTLWIELPAHLPPAEGTIVAGHRVLICEDDEEIATLIQSMLNQEGFVADVAHTLAEAREKLRLGHYAAMTLDLLFPLGDVMELAEEMRPGGALAGLPIIVVSGTKREGWPELDASVGIIDWLTKPVGRKRLLLAVAKATGKLPKRAAAAAEQEPPGATAPLAAMTPRSQ